MAFRFLQRLSDFLQRLSAFSNGFPNFSNGFPIFLNGFPLSKKSKKIYLRWQVYKRSPFELRISRHLLPELRNCHVLPELCNCHSLPKLCKCHLLPELSNCYSLPKLCNRYNACISPNSQKYEHRQSHFDFLNNAYWVSFFKRNNSLSKICFS
jgi:hypothetical protein